MNINNFNKWLLVIAICFVVSPPLYAEPKGLDSQLEQFYKEAEQAIKEEDHQKSDFYSARYMGKSLFNEDTDKSITDLYPLFKEQNLLSTSLLSRAYDMEFIEWFVYSPARYWANDMVIWEDIQYAFKINGAGNGNYYVVISAYPFIEAWSVTGQETAYSTAFVALAKKPFIVSGELTDGKSSKEFEEVELDVYDLALQHIWKPEFHDLDNDGIPEIWLRYNITQGTGFFQELVIYKIENDKLLLFKKFTGDAEGIARRLEDGTIEVAEGFTDSKATGHLGYDQHHFETFEYKNGEFVKVSEKDVPHILHSEVWKDYYLAEQERG